MKKETQTRYSTVECEEKIQLPKGGNLGHSLEIVWDNIVYP